VAENKDVKNSKAWLENAQSLVVVYDELLRLVTEMDGVSDKTIASAQAAKAEALERLQLTMQQLEAEGKLTDAASRRQSIIAAQKRDLTTQMQMLTQTDAQRAASLKSEEDSLKKLEKARGNLGEKTEQNQREFAVLAQKIASKEADINNLKAQGVELQGKAKDEYIKTVGAQLRSLTAQEELSGAVQQTMSTLMGLDNKWRKTFFGALSESIAAISNAEKSGQALMSAATSFNAALAGASSFGNVVGSSLMKIQETTIKMVQTIDQSEISLRRASGAGEEFAEGLSEAWDDREIQRMAGSMQELSQATASLYSNYRAFSENLPGSQLELSRLALAANRVGINFDDFATVVEKSTRIFGDTATAAMSRLYNSAIAIGEVPARMVKNYISSLDTLAQYSGPRAIKVFQELSAMSKATGIEMQRLVSVADRFDTFESAADSTAKLNAILGGPYLNSVQMLNASEEERLRLLRGTLDATNRSWESLGRFERKAFAAAAGFQSLAVAAAFFQGNMAKVDELTKNQEKQDEAQRQLIMSASKLTPIMDRLARFADRFGKTLAKTVMPAVKIFMRALDRFGPIGLIGAKVLLGLVTNTISYAVQTRIAAAAQGKMVSGFAAIRVGAMSALPMFGLLIGAVGLFALTMNKKESPPIYQIPSIMASGFQQMASSAGSSSRALKRLSVDLSAMRSPVAGLDVKKITSFGNAIGQMGYALKDLPKENVVAVTNVIRESRYAGALGPAATARAASAFAAQGAAVVRAQAAAPAPGGGAAQGPGRGVFITDRVQFQIGGHLIERTVEDITNRMVSNRVRSA